MHDIIVMALANRVRVEQMTIEQIPETYRRDVERRLTDG